MHEAAEKFTDHLKALVDTAIPQREIVERKGTHPWISNSVLQLVQERNAAMGTPEESAAILKCSDGMLAARREYESRTCRELMDMPPGCKCWWKKSRELMNRKATAAAIPALRASDDSDWCLTAKAKADLFATTFQSKCVLRDQEDPHPVRLSARCQQQEWMPADISVEAVGLELKKLREDSATGPDLLSSRVLKMCADVLAEPVHRLLMRVLDEGEWPAAWIVHWLVPIYKRKAAGSPGNYRGVHLTAQLSKVVERLILSMLQPFITENLHSGSNQFAYTRERGARDAVALLATAWIAASNGRMKIGVYCSDVSGAFDKVDATILVSKLQQMRVHPKMVKVVQSWLRRRTGHVLVAGSKSAEMALEDMVFQGTVLGPQLWNLFFADAAEPIRITGHTEIVYADDMNACRFHASDIDND